MPSFSADQLKNLGFKMFRAAGANDEQARTVPEVLVAASLHGVDSHGIRAMPGHIESIRKGTIRADARISVLKDTPTTALWDGGAEFGHVVAKKAMDEAIRKADAYRIGWVSTVSNHIGALYYYALMAAKRDMIGMVLCRTETKSSFRPKGGSVAPYGGIEGRLGTNPLAVCIPTNRENPIVLDMATSVVAAGHMGLMAERGEKVPDGWLLDKDGNPTNDARDSREGFMLPFGTYKGYGLSVVIAALPMFLPFVGLDGEDKPRPWGHSFIALDPAGFMSTQYFKERTDALIGWIKSCPPRPGMRVLIPGEPEWQQEELRSREGIQVDEPFWQRLTTIGKEIGVDIDETVKS